MTLSHGRSWCAVALALIASAWSAAAQAQTALVVVGSEGDRELQEQLAIATTVAVWRYGPIVHATGVAGAAEVVDGLTGNTGVTSVVLLSVHTQNEPGRLDALAAAGEVRVLVAPQAVVARAGMTPEELARAIERGASYAVAVLSESGQDVISGSFLHRLSGINVTATREAREGFDTPRPVSVVGRTSLRERLPNNAADLFRDIPGLDVEGVGPNQRRPVIRGLRGQRVLLLEDGLRINNSRRRLDSGEPPAIGGVFELDRVEVVRGASSVLYGSDAIGGVMNLIPHRSAPGISGSDVRGAIQYRYGTAAEQHGISGKTSGRVGRLAFNLGASYRDASAYNAPAGQFGDLSLSSDTRVQDTGVEDLNLGVRLEYRISEVQEVFARVTRYRAMDTGFGFVEPEDLGVGGARVQLLWPDLKFDRIVAGYETRGLNTAIADRLTIKGYRQSNEREFLTNVFIPFDPDATVGPGVEIASENFTDIDTYGARVEASKLLAGRHLLTYGVDYYRDRSYNTDSRTRTVVGAGPPNPSTDETPGLPNASLGSVGVFAQTVFAVDPSFDLTLGLRYQGVRSETRETEGLDEPLTELSEQTVVGAANALVRVSDRVNLVASLGRGFRSPNLVERFFSGDTPDGTGVWIRNPELGAETSLSADLGARLRGDRVYAEGFVFGNFLKNGIQLRPTGDVIDGSPVFQNVNVSRIDILGFELTVGTEIASGWVMEGGFTHLSASNPDDPEDRVMEGYRDRLNGRLRYEGSGDRFWAEYEIRHSGSTDDIAPGVSPVGDRIPAFTVQALRAGIRVFGQSRIGVAVENLGNALYAEPINVAFFRPEPRRALTVSWTTEF